MQIIYWNYSKSPITVWLDSKLRGDVENPLGLYVRKDTLQPVVMLYDGRWVVKANSTELNPVRYAVDVAAAPAVAGWQSIRSDWLLLFTTYHAVRRNVSTE